MSSRNIFVDELKGFACLLVVLDHVLLGLENAMGYENVPFIARFMEDYIGKFHVALFMFLSGFVFMITGGPCQKGSRVKTLAYKIVNLGIPYLFFSIVYIVLNSLMSSSVNKAFSSRDILDLWRTPVAQYWFLYALIWIFIIYIVLSKWLKPKYVTVFLFLIYCIFSFNHISFSLLGSAMSVGVVFGIGMSVKDISVDRIPTGVRTGVLIVQMLISGILICEMVPMHHFYQLIGIVGSLAFVSLVDKLESIKRFLLYICKYSFPIYLLHTIFTSAVRIVMIKVGIDIYPLHVFVGMLIGVTIPVIVGIISDNLVFTNIVFYPSRTIKQLKRRK